MPVQRVVISWLAVLLLINTGFSVGWRTISRVLNFIQATLEGRPAPGIGFSIFEGLLCLCMAVLALAISSPWLHQLLGRRFQTLTPWLTEPLADKLNIAGRWILSLGCLALVFKKGAFALLPAGIFVLPEISLLFTAGPSSFIDAVFFPGGRETKPPYTLKLARHYVAEKRWADAHAEFERVLSYHPDQLEAWQEWLTLALTPRPGADLPDHTPEDILAMAIRALADRKEQETIHRQFLNARP
jgi:hypothetical protein